MLTKPKNLPPGVTDSNYLLAVVHRSTIPEVVTGRCRFDMFVRIKPGIPSPLPRQQRTWCYRGDKYVQEDHRMLRSLLNLLKKRIHLFDRVVLYDHSRPLQEYEILRIVDDTIEKNQLLRSYSFMLSNYVMPDYLKVTV